MDKVLQVAWRDFKAVVFTRGFVFAVFFPLVIMGGAIMLTPLLMNQKAPKVNGHFAVLDRTGEVAPRVERAYSSEAVEERRKARSERINKAFGQAKESGLMTEEQEAMAKSAADAAAALDAGSIRVRTLAADADPEPIKSQISAVDAKNRQNTEETPLALAVVPPEAVNRGAEGFGSFELFLAPKLDVEVSTDFRRQVERAVTDARINAAGFDVSLVRGLIDPPQVIEKTLTAEGERKTNQFAAFMVPFGFLMLLWISVFSAGQYLLTSTVEEKSSRVMEVLLSAVSPTQLIVGKILGQMGVGLLVLLCYTALGGGALVFFRLGHLLDPTVLVYFVIFFILAFFMIASVMAAIGSAVNEMREAQALLGPVMIVLIIPMILWMPIMRNPNSLFATICSFVPPVNPFIMVLRLGGSEKIPVWQIWASIGVGVIGSFVAAWAAGKIFRIGVLMYGKPPNVATLLRWIRMA